MKDYSKMSPVVESAPKGMGGMGSQTGTLSKHPIDSLHDGSVHTPLTSLASQSLKVNGMSGASMSSKVNKGGGAGETRNAKGMGRSMAKEVISNAKKMAK